MLTSYNLESSANNLLIQVDIYGYFNLNFKVYFFLNPDKLEKICNFDFLIHYIGEQIG